MFSSCCLNKWSRTCQWWTTVPRGSGSGMVWYGVTPAMIEEDLTQTIVDPFPCRCFWRLSLNTTYANFDCSNIIRNVNTLLVIGANLFAMMRLNWACSINWGCIRHITTKCSTSKICYRRWLDFETRILGIWLLFKFNNALNPSKLQRQQREF